MIFFCGIGFMEFLVYLSYYMIPLIIFYIVGFGLLMKVDVYGEFVKGAKDGMSQKEFAKYIKSTLPDINKELPNYARLAKIEVMSEAFERTPKKSIKRYLYQRK